MCVIPEGVTSMDSNTWYYTMGVVVIMLPKTPPSIASGTFGYGSYSIYVPDDSQAAYQAAEYWSRRTIKNFSQLAIDHPDYYERYITQG